MEIFKKKPFSKEIFSQIGKPLTLCYNLMKSKLDVFGFTEMSATLTQLIYERREGP